MAVDVLNLQKAQSTHIQTNATTQKYNKPEKVADLIPVLVYNYSSRRNAEKIFLLIFSLKLSK